MVKGRKVICWILTGIVFSLAVASMIQTRHGSIGQFYNEGYIENITKLWKAQVVLAGKYNQETGYCEMEAGNGDIGLAMFEVNEAVNYLLLDFEDRLEDGTLWRVIYQNEQMEEIERETLELAGGEHVLKLKDNGYKNLTLYLCSDSDVKVRIHDMQLTEYSDIVESEKIWYTAGVCSVVYILTSSILWLVRRKRPQRQPVGMIKGLEQQADCMLSHMQNKKNQNSYAGTIRTFLFMMIIIGWRIANLHGVNKYYGYIVCYSVVIFLLLISWIPTQRTAISLDNRLTRLWLAVFALQFVSDVLIQKSYGFGSVWMLVCFGLLFRAWARMEKPQVLLYDFAKAIGILAAMHIVYCCFGDARKYELGRLTGTWKNPNPFAMGVVVYQVVMLYWICRGVAKKERWWKLILPGIGFCAGIWMLYGAECRTAWLAFVAIVGGLFVYLVVRRLPKTKKTYIGIGIFCVLFGGAALVMLVKGMQILFPSRSFAADLDVTSGRFMIWTEYTKHMNLFGHDGVLKINGINTFGHNGVIKIAYKYGVITGIIHVAFLYETVVAGCKYLLREQRIENVVLVIGALLAYLIPTMLESIDEIPMEWLGWFAFYFVIGYLMQGENFESRRDEKNR